MANKSNQSDGSIAQNRKAWRDYGIDEEMEAGLVLMGTEVKSLRAGKVNIVDGFVAAKNEELWLTNVSIGLYSHGNRQNHEERRPRKLLLHKKQIAKMLGYLKVKGTTIVPLSLYFNTRGVAKVKLGVGRGKKEYEKRDDIKKRDWQRDKSRILREKNG